MGSGSMRGIIKPNKPLNPTNMGSKASSRQAHTTGIQWVANMAVSRSLIPRRFRRKVQPQLRNCLRIRAQWPPRSHPILTNLQYRGDAVLPEIVSNKQPASSREKLRANCLTQGLKEGSGGSGANRSSSRATAAQRIRSGPEGLIQPNPFLDTNN